MERRARQRRALETALRAGLGAHGVTDGRLAGEQWLFSESPTRVVVSTGPHEAAPFAHLCERRGVPCMPLGEVVDGGALVFEGLLDLELAAAGHAWRSGLRAAIDEPVG
jgi:hypothetical protein